MRNSLRCYTKIFPELKNVPVTFQRATDVILATVKWHYAVLYIDGLIIFSSTAEGYEQQVEILFKLVQEAGMALRIKICHWFPDSTVYFEQVITPGKLRVAKKPVKSVQTLKYTTLTTMLRYVLRLCNA